MKWLLAAALALGGCQARSATELLVVNAVVPTEAQLGQEVQILGEGFALGSGATVTFRGVVHRAGRAARPVDISFPAQTESQRELSVTLPRAAEVTLCGGSDESSHATFRGDVEVAIAAKAPGAPPVTGTLQGAVLELYPASRERALEERQIAEGKRALAFFGMEVASGGPGLTIVRLAPGSRAVAADLRPGDRVVRAGGVSVLSPSDLVPSAARTLEVGIVRGASELSVQLEADGFARRPPDAVTWAALPLLAVAFGLVFYASPLLGAGRWVALNWLELRGALRRRGRRAPAAASWAARHWVTVLVWLGVGATVLSPVLRRAPVDVPLGLVALMFIASTLISITALLRGGSTPRGWLLGAGVRAACRQALAIAPAWVALLSGWGAAETETALASLPDGLQRWSALGNPGELVAFAVMLLSALPAVAGGSPGLRHARATSWAGVRRSDWVVALYTCSVCATAASAFLGAELSPEARHSPDGVPLGMALLSLVEYTMLVVIVTGLRRYCLDLSADEWVPIAGGVLLPIAALAALAAHGLRALPPMPPIWQWLAAVYGPAAAVLLLGGGALFAWRIARAARKPATASVTPWS